MAETTIGTIDELLTSAQADITDAETELKLQLALHLLEAVEKRHVAGREGVDDALVDDEVRDQLRDLGYL